MVRSLFLLFLFTGLIGGFSPVRAQIDSSLAAMPSAAWLEDLDYLESELPKRHVAWDQLVRRDEFLQAVARVRRILPMSNPHQRIVRLMELAAMARDESTLISVFRTPVSFRVFPLQIYRFDDGWYVIGADIAYTKLIGTRLARIGTQDIDAAFKSVKPVISAENDYGAAWWFGLFGLMPEVLAAQGVIAEPGPAPFTFVMSDGRTVTREIVPITFREFAQQFYFAKVVGNSSPALSNHRTRHFWFERRASNTLFVQFNEIRDSESESVASFVRRVWNDLEANPPERVVVDLRTGGGGSGDLLGAVTTLLGEHPAMNQPGKLFVLIGPRTAGTCLELASMLEYRSKAVFVGKPTGEGPNGVGDSGMFTLPNSGIGVFYTASFWPTSFADDDRRWIDPDVRIEYTYRDHADGTDPWMDAVMAYRPRQRSPAVTSAVIEQLKGRYAFSSYQVLTIDEEAGSLWMRIEDAIPGSYIKVRAELRAQSSIRLSCDISDVLIDIASVPGERIDQLFISWKGKERTIERLPFGVHLPGEMIAMGKTRQGISAMLADDDGRGHYQRYGIYYLQDIGNDALERGNYTDAILAFDAVCQFAPDDVGSWISLGQTYALAGKTADARRAYEEVLELDPTNQDAVNALRRLQLRPHGG